MILGEMAVNNATRYPDKTALIFGKDRFTFKEFNNRVNRLANAMLSMGIAKGERIAILSENSHQYVETYFAAAKTGLILLPLNTKLSGPELIYIINDAGAGTLILEEKYIKAVDAIRPELKKINQLIIIGDTKDNGFETMLSKYSSDEPDVRVAGSDPICLFYTSGTTGKPKGVLTTHKNLIVNAFNPVSEFKFKHEDKNLLITSLYHVAAQWPLISHFYLGATNVLLEKFEPKTTLEAIEKEKITTINAVPIMIAELLRQPDIEDYDLSSLHFLAYGASPMPVPVLKEALNKFGQIMVQVYGLTESGGIVTFLPKSEHNIKDADSGESRIKSCGKAINNVKVRVVDKNYADVSPGQVGEIIVQGDGIMKCYWLKPQATRETLKDGYLYTGDLATVDEEGYIYILDRKKDMIISGGENIYSREVEEAIFIHPFVNDVAVVGVPDSKWGESVKAIVVLKPDKKITANDIIEFCRQQIASYKKPKSVEFVNELPRNVTGKVLKKVLREKFGGN